LDCYLQRLVFKGKGSLLHLGGGGDSTLKMKNEEDRNGACKAPPKSHEFTSCLEFRGGFPPPVHFTDESQ